MRSKYCYNGGSRDKSWATTWGESHRHQQMNPIYVSTINSTPRNIKELRWREVLQQGYFLVRLWFLLQSYRSLLYSWYWYLLTYESQSWQTSRCLTSYHFHRGVPIYFVDIGIRMWCLFSWWDTHIHRKYWHRDAHVCVNIGMGGCTCIFVWKWASEMPIFGGAYSCLTLDQQKYKPKTKMGNYGNCVLNSRLVLEDSMPTCL